jgi:CheY-like chemotaxis protein
VSNALTLLLVEENPMVLGMLRQALEPFARVIPATSAQEALQCAGEHKPDVVLTDFRLPGMDGAELAHRMRKDAKAVILLASKADLTGPLAGSKDSFDDVIEKPFYTRDAVARVRRVLDKIWNERSRGGGDTIVRGSLAQMSVMDLLQTMEIGRKTCGLTLTRGASQCDMFFVEGQLVHAVCGNVIGDEAVFQAVRWSDNGAFQIDFKARTTDQTTTRSTQGLLLEGLRLLDEAKRDENILGLDHH